VTGKNALAYDDKELITAVEGFIVPSREEPLRRDDAMTQSFAKMAANTNAYANEKFER
jgi:hypothetical protein